MTFRRSGVSLFLALTVLAALPSAAQQMKAMPAAPVEQAEMLAPPPGLGSIVFLELFSAENCPFCPLAEQHFNDVTADQTVIGYSCMVNYFDSGQSQTSRSFCGGQQDFYIERLVSGSRYTPQLVINGEAQLPGHDLQKLAAGIQAARQKASQPLSLDIKSGTTPGTFSVQLPVIPQGKEGQRFALRIVMLKSETDVSELTSKRHARDRMPHNLATAMIESGLWNGTKTIWLITPPADAEGDSFIAMVQDRDTGRILAAGIQEISKAKSQ